MARPGPRRQAVAIKLGDRERDAIDARALAEGLTIRGGEPWRSEMIRRLIAYALTHMPPRWTDLKEQTMITITEIAAAVGMSSNPRKVAAFAGCLSPHDPRTGRIPQPWHGQGMDAVFSQEQAERLIAEWHRAAHDAEVGRIEPIIEAGAGLDLAAADRRHNAAVAEVQDRYRP